MNNSIKKISTCLLVAINEYELVLNMNEFILTYSDWMRCIGWLLGQGVSVQQSLHVLFWLSSM